MFRDETEKDLVPLHTLTSQLYCGFKPEVNALIRVFKVMCVRAPDQ